MPGFTFINQQNARDLQQKSVVSRQKNKLAAEQEQIAEKPQQPPPAIPPSPDFASRVTKTIEGLIDQTTDGFVTSSKPRDQQCLAMALDRLLGSWSLLTGHPRPGVRRVTKDSNRAPGPAFSPQDHEDPPSHEPL